MVYCGISECKFNVISCVGEECCEKEYLHIDSSGRCMDYEIYDSTESEDES